MEWIEKHLKSKKKVWLPEYTGPGITKTRDLKRRTKNRKVYEAPIFPLKFRAHRPGDSIRRYVSKNFLYIVVLLFMVLMSFVTYLFILPRF